MTEKSYIDLELFPCAGGFAEGFRRAGVTFDLAIELEGDHCSSYEANLKHRPIRMDAHDFYRLICTGTWRPQKRVRLLVADPPCTPWSRSGKREGLLDPRDCLALTCNLIRELRPDVYLIGNVPGLDDEPNLAVVQKHIGSLSQYGYCSADYARLDAANYGVPQHRIRPFWFGHLNGPCITWPEPTHGDPDEMRDQIPLPSVQSLIPWVTCRQALGHLTGKDLGRPVRLRHRNSNTKQHGSVPERPARVVGTSNLSDGNVILPADAPRAGKRGHLRGTSQGNRVQNIDTPSSTVVAKETRNRKVSTVTVNAKHAPADADAPAPTLGAKQRMQSAQVIQATSKHPSSKSGEPANTLRASDGEGSNRTVEWPWNRPATTVQRDERLAPAGHHDERLAPAGHHDERLAPAGHHDEWSIMSHPNAVVISEKAAAILQGFPDGWVFIGKTKKQRWSQIGQAMPPPLAHAVAASVVQQIDKTKGFTIEMIDSVDRCEHGVTNNGSCHRCFATTLERFDYAATVTRFTEHECKVCGALPGIAGERVHGKGCYEVSEDGGGIDHPMDGV